MAGTHRTSCCSWEVTSSPVSAAPWRLCTLSNASNKYLVLKATCVGSVVCNRESLTRSHASGLLMVKSCGHCLFLGCVDLCLPRWMVVVTRSASGNSVPLASVVPDSPALGLVLRFLYLLSSSELLLFPRSPSSAHCSPHCHVYLGLLIPS